MFPHLGEHLVKLEQTESTQDDAKRLVLSQGIRAARTAVYTEHQTSGRGRRGKVWYAAPGNNVCLTVIAPPVPQVYLWRVTFVAGVAVADALGQLLSDADIRLRFPNDVLLNGKKVSGILVETETGEGVPEGHPLPLVGIGVNVRGDTGQMPPDVAVRATTIEHEYGVTLLPASVRDTILQSLSTVWDHWTRSEGFTSLLSRWQEYLDSDARRTFSLNGIPTSCRVLTVSPEGMVTLELPDGSPYVLPVVHVLL